LNSDIATFLHFNNSPKATKGDFPKILISDLKNFPVVIPTENIQNLLRIFVPYIVLLTQFDSKDLEFNFFDQVVNSIIFELYFSKELKAANKEILKHLGDIKPITDEMSEEEKSAIIQAEFERLYDPNHPVRYAIETLDSIEEVRIIKEALK